VDAIWPGDWFQARERFEGRIARHFVARNYPSPYVYRPDMRLLQDDFPAAADVRRFFPD